VPPAKAKAGTLMPGALGSSVSTVFGDSSFIPLPGAGKPPGASKTISKYVTAPAAAAKPSGFNFLGKKLTPPPSVVVSPALGLLSRTPFDTGGSSAPPSVNGGSTDPNSGGGSRINLLALEKEQKKLKKKRLSFSSA
jgi:hypothetical protein